MTKSNSEIFRTAHKYTEGPWRGLGAGLKHGINEVCPSCMAGSLFDDGTKAGSVEQIKDEAALAPYKAFYEKSDWRAYQCHSCGASWSWYREKTDNNEETK